MDSGPRPWLATTPDGLTATAACSAWTRTTDSPANAPRQGPSTRDRGGAPELARSARLLGLAKVAPPHLAPQVLEERISALQAERAGLEKEVEEKSEPLHGLGLEVMALSATARWRRSTSTATTSCRS
jgi:hypothetical protein